MCVSTYILYIRGLIIILLIPYSWYKYIFVFMKIKRKNCAPILPLTLASKVVAPNGYTYYNKFTLISETQKYD